MESKARIDDIIFKVANSGNNNHIVKSSWLFNFFSGLYIPDTVFYSFQVWFYLKLTNVHSILWT